jgi:dUTPase
MIETVPLKVVKLPHAAGLPDYATETAAGMDLMAATSGDVVLHPGGTATAMPDGTTDRSPG